MEKSSQGCYDKVHLAFCDSRYKVIIKIQN